MNPVPTPTAWQPRLLLEAELKKVEDRLAVTPDAVELRFDRAVLLRELGRTDAAKQAYLELLSIAPTHFGGLNNLGTLAMETGFQTAARTAYVEAIKHHPDNPMGHINLANLLTKIEDTTAALKHFEIALQLDPDHADAHQGLARLLSEIGREDEARSHRINGFRGRSVKILPYRGTGRPRLLLLLASAAGGAVPIWYHLDDQRFLTSVVFVDVCDPDLRLPNHELVFNAIGDADLCQSDLETAATLLRQTTAPVINRPQSVKPTGRAANARRLGQLPGVVTAEMALMPREQLAASDATSQLASKGITFPLLLRSPGFHNGSFFARITNEAELKETLPTIPGREILAIQFLDARSADGKIRKYRVMLIGGQIYPLHVAISHEWKIHFFSAEMADNPENRAEDAAFLEKMPAVLGSRAMAGLEQIRDTLGLDYAGVDFSVSPEGDILLFEANATMVVNPADADTKWDYRRPYVQRILDAISDLLTGHEPRRLVVKKGDTSADADRFGSGL